MTLPIVLPVEGSVFEIGPSFLELNHSAIGRIASSLLGEKCSEDLAWALFDAIEGWPVLLPRYLRILRSESTSQWVNVVRRHHADRELIATALQDLALTHDEASRLGALASLDRFDVEMFRHVMLDASENSNLPCVLTSDGDIAVMQLARQWALSKRTPQHLDRLAHYMATHDQPMAAMRMLIAADRVETAGEILSQTRRSQADAIAPSELLAMCGLLEPLRLERVSMFKARALELSGSLEEAQAFLTDTILDDAKSPALVAELFWVKAMSDRQLDLIGGIDIELSRTDLSKEREARLAGAKGVVLCQQPDLERVVESEIYLRRAASLWLLIGEPHEAARVLRVFGSMTCMQLGRFEEAEVAFQRSLELTHELPNAQLFSLIGLAMTYARDGQISKYQEVEPAARRLAKDLGLTWATGYLEWYDMLIAAWLDNPDRVQGAFHRAIDLLDRMEHQPTFAAFLVEAAEALSRVKLHDEARVVAKRATAHPESTHKMLVQLEVTIGATTRQSKHSESWLYEHVEQLRLSNNQYWRAKAELAMKFGKEVPLPPVKLEEVLKLRFRAAQPELHVQLLNKFEVRLDGRPVKVPDGHVNKLIKLLALKQGHTSRDWLIEALWPEVSPVTGRKRLRNVLLRSRDLFQKHFRTWKADFALTKMCHS